MKDKTIKFFFLEETLRECLHYFGAHKKFKQDPQSSKDKGQDKLKICTHKKV